ncbi:uncharacterized protein [Gossypium hirsutum]|uniref:Gag-Pol polyprotein n=1 Tax=Gossypium hirsutum TaxID=3635 RepID=A0ABM3BLK6_GOSHI|nr:uncharacterized protein LOC121228955 [Gossypium hirsutum]
MTVTEYEREFVRLSKYARECVSTEAIMCRRFEDRLNEDIQLLVGILELREFVVLVERACKVEKLVKEKRKAYNESRDSKKRQMGRSFQTSSKRSKEFPTQSNASVGFSNRNKNKQYTVSKAQTTSIASVGSARPNRPECSQCDRHHFNECRRNEIGYYKCGSLDHFIRSYPEMVEKDRDQGVRSGNAFSRSKPQKNPGSRASNRGVPRDFTVRSESRAPTRTFTIPAREEASSPNVITGTFSLHNILVVALIDLGSTHLYASVKLMSSMNMPVESGEPDSLPVLISCMTTEKYMRQRYESYLAFVLNAQESEVRIESVHVVCEYLDVFPEELPGLPPTKEVKFGIELVPSTAPISVAPYRMTPLELKELNVQLQELMDKGFKRLSYSLASAPVLFVKQKDRSMRFILTGCYDSLGRIWKQAGWCTHMPEGQSGAISSGEVVSTLVGHTQCLSYMVWPQHDTIYKASWDHSIRKWGVGTGKDLSDILFYVLTGGKWNRKNQLH